MIENKGVRDSYKHYKETATQEVLDIKTYVLISNTFNAFLMDKVFEGYEITLPKRMGTLKIVGTKQKITFDENNQIKGLAPDFKATKEYWSKNPDAAKQKKFIYHMNEHTNNVRYRFHWSKKSIFVLNKTVYNLIFTRDNKRRLSKLIKEGKEYIIN